MKTKRPLVRGTLWALIDKREARPVAVFVEKRRWIAGPFHQWVRVKFVEVQRQASR